MDDNRFSFNFVNPVVNNKYLRSTKSASEIILEIATEKLQQWWSVHHKPYLLSKLGNDLLKAGINYRAALHPQGLKGFLQSAPDHFKFVEDPIHAEKIGIIPPNNDSKVVMKPKEIVAKNYDVPSTNDDQSLKRWKIVNDFLDLVARLDDDDIKKIRLPLHILTKLRNLGDV